MDISAPRSPFSDLSITLREMRGKVGDWGFYGWLSQALVGLLYGRLGVIMGKMERLAARFQAGKLWRPAARPVASQRMVAEAKGDLPPRAVRIWPGQFAWLVRACGYRSAAYASQVQAVLVQPEMVALLMAAPQAGRILRPLCRMLGVEASLLRPGVAGEVAVAEIAAIVKQKRVRAPRKPIDWGRNPLPRGVLSAARRQGFGKLK